MMNKTEALVQRTLRKVFSDNSLIFDKSHFAGGLTNYNYIMEIHGKHYVIREPGLMTEKMLNRPAEAINNVIASGLGINSVCVFYDKDTGIKISEYIQNAQTFTAVGPGAPECLRAVAALLKSTHASPQPFPNVFDWESELLKYERLTQECHGQLFSDYPHLKESLFAFIRKNVPSLDLLPCHNDTVPENFLLDPKTHRPYLIDWEYSGMNDPAWDIAVYIGESRLSAHAIEEFFSDYYGSEGPSTKEVAKIKCFIMAQDLLWAIWALVRHYSGEDFLDYCYNRYNRFRRNLKVLESDPFSSISEMVRW